MKRITVSNLLIVVFIFAISTLSATNAPTGENKSIFDRLSENEVLQLSIKTDLGKLLGNRKKEKYQSASFNIVESDNTETKWDIQLRVRGKFRVRVCDFPSLKLKFGHSVIGPENLKAFNTLKLVTHCGDQAETEELVQKEYLAYKLCNSITAHSFRVQLVKINWIDSKGKHEIGEKWGFLIENEDELAHRLKGGVYEEFGVEYNDINPSNAALISLYQYLIGNTDWDLKMNKNLRMVKSHSTNDIYVIPYDFDFSGLVNAYYAVSEHGQTSVKERLYLGESNAEDLKECVNLFKSKKDQILSIVNSYQYLSRSKRKDVKSYVQSFFRELDEPLKTKKFYEDRRAAQKVVKPKKSG